MNEKKIAFIICVNDEKRYAECIHYIERLIEPEGFEVEAFAIRGADSIFKAYNQAMEQSDAKYKIYMHQDVLLLKQDMLQGLVAFFQQHPQIGMIGLLGGTEYPVSRRFYRAWNVGNVLGCSDKKAFHNHLCEDARKVLAIDGMFMMTQYDLPWRNDVLDGWDFYDFSQSLEFWKHGYEVWVPAQKEPWSLHDCGYLKLADYDERLDKFLNVYGTSFPAFSDESMVYKPEYREHYTVMMRLKDDMKQLLFMGKEAEVRVALERAWDERFIDTEFAMLKTILDILEKEKQEDIEKGGFLEGVEAFEQAREKYLDIKYAFWRKEYLQEGEAIDMINVTNEAKEVIRRRCLL